MVNAYISISGSRSRSRYLFQVNKCYNVIEQKGYPGNQTKHISKLANIIERFNNDLELTMEIVDQKYLLVKILRPFLAKRVTAKTAVKVPRTLTAKPIKSNGRCTGTLIPDLACNHAANGSAWNPLFSLKHKEICSVNHHV